MKFCTHCHAEYTDDYNWQTCHCGGWLQTKKSMPQTTPVIPGVGPDAPTVTDPKTGAKQSATPARLDLMPALALFNIGEILQTGAAKYGVDNWRGIPCREHLNKVLIHIYAHLAGDRTDDHLGHAGCRMLMALEQNLASKISVDPSL